MDRCTWFARADLPDFSGFQASAMTCVMEHPVSSAMYLRSWVAFSSKRDSCMLNVTLLPFISPSICRLG